MKNSHSELHQSIIISPKSICAILFIFVSILSGSGCQSIKKTENSSSPQRIQKNPELSVTRQETLEPSPFGEISDTSKPNWYGIYPGMSETQSIQLIKNISGSKFQILKRDKSYVPDNILDTTDKFYYVDEYIEIHINDGSYVMISISKGYVVLLDINIENYTIDDCINLLGKPEKVSAYFRRTGGIGYNFFNMTIGYVFSGEISQQPQKNNQLKPGYPVSNIYLVSPEDFHYIYESYLTGYINEDERKTMMDDWRDFDSINIRNN